ncbi:MAG: prepilin-type N-terminal cleavage/methylation domain-containing protein [Patescibacteria group bacterium]
MKSFLSSRRSGYTIIELLVVVAIMAITSATLISFNRLGQDQTTLYVEASRVIDIILRAKSLAISAYRDPGGRLTCAHGLHIDQLSSPASGGSASPTGNKSFSLSAYLKKEAGGTDPVFPCADITSSTARMDNYDRVVVQSSVYQLASGITFDRAETNAADIIFRPPDPQIVFFKPDGTPFPNSSTSIVITSKDGSDKIRISVGQGGQVTYNFVD